MNTQHNGVSEQWSSKWTFILAATGAAVGLGNIWRFPYLIADNGGSAFLFLYLFFLVILGIPILMSEILLGRHTRHNAIDALKSLAQQHQRSSRWQSIGWAGALALLLILAFYSVVSGICLSYLWHAVTQGFQTHGTAPQTVWLHLTGSATRLALWHTLFMLLTIGVILLGIKKGLEKATQFMMPTLYLVLIALVVYALIYGDGPAAMHFLFDFDPSKLLNINTISMALGQAFFSLALGAGAMLAYGAYAPKNTPLTFAASVVAVLEALVAILAGLAIYPLLFQYHLPTTAMGDSLMFRVLPLAFAQIPGGYWIAITFFVSLLFAAWTSSINLCEPLVLLLIQKWNIKRRRATVLVGSCAWAIGLLSLLSYNVLKHFTLAGWTLMQWNVNFPTNILLPLGGLGYAIFCGWILPQRISQQEINNSRLFPVWFFLIRFVAPVAILGILIFNFI
jgi:neurotransmitter:Na+ symporter, NSS family